MIQIPETTKYDYELYVTYAQMLLSHTFTVKGLVRSQYPHAALTQVNRISQTIKNRLISNGHITKDQWAAMIKKNQQDVIERRKGGLGKELLALIDKGEVPVKEKHEPGYCEWCEEVCGREVDSKGQPHPTCYKVACYKGTGFEHLAFTVDDSINRHLFNIGVLE